MFCIQLHLKQREEGLQDSMQKEDTLVLTRYSDMMKRRPLFQVQLERRLTILVVQCQAYQRMISLQLETLHRLERVSLQQTHPIDWSSWWQHSDSISDSHHSGQRKGLLHRHKTHLGPHIGISKGHSFSGTSRELNQQHGRKYQKHIQGRA